MPPAPWVASWFLFLLLAPAWAEEDLTPPGHRPRGPEVHLLQGARLVIEPGRVIERGEVLLREGHIAAVGEKVEAPPEARIWNYEGRTIYAGLIEPWWVEEPAPPPAEPAKPASCRDEHERLASAPFYGAPGETQDRGAPGPGAAHPMLRPQRRMAEEYTTDPKALEALRELGYTAALRVPRGGVLPGQSALVALREDDPNTVIIDDRVFQHASFETERRRFPESAMGAIAAFRQAFLDARFQRAARTTFLPGAAPAPRPEFDPAATALEPVLDGAPLCFATRGALELDRAATLARELGLEALALAEGDVWRRPDLVRRADLPLIATLAQSEIPRLPDPADRVQLSLDQLRAWDWAPQVPALLHGLGLPLALSSHGLRERSDFRAQLKLALACGLDRDAALAALTTVPARHMGLDDRLGRIAPGYIANLTVVRGDYFDPEAKIEAVFIDGRHIPVVPRKGEPPQDAQKPKAEDEAKAKEQAEAKLRLRARRAARAPSADRGVLSAPAAVWVRGATIWTQGPRGWFLKADLIAVDGRITQIGENLAPPAGLRGRLEIIDAAGKHLVPGIIDCHNHSMIWGDVNESGLPSTAMVRIADCIDSETEDIYRQLAGGVTAVNLLHGSANPIGGQNAVIKLRDGAAPDEMLLAGAPAGIKFALGENVKQSNWGDEHRSRYPQTRMGVRSFILNRFEAARRYREQAEPRKRDLELEALVEILESRRLVHCHAYRQDEMLMLMRLMESQGARIATFQHVLEGYKIADEIAAHGGGASTFADWWAYKYEVVDAIPYNAALMTGRGVLVSINSDSGDHARRLNLEAAKAMKYGGLDPREALALVTINPARQLGIAERVGSLEVGKDADFALWSASPLSTRAACEQTWIEGRKYFDRALDEVRTQVREAERAELLAKFDKLQAGEQPKGTKDK